MRRTRRGCNFGWHERDGRIKPQKRDARDARTNRRLDKSSI
jgi:hypothetical protein